MTRILDDYLLEIRGRLRALPYAQQDGLVAEARAHIANDVAARRKADPTLSLQEAELAATAAFGDPGEVAAQPGGGALVRKSTGEVLLRAAVLTGRAAKATGKAAGRGARSTLKWTGIVLLVLLVTGLLLVVVGAFVGTHLADTYHDQIVESVPHQVYRYSGVWPVTSPNADVHQEAFTVPADSREVHVTFVSSPQAGCVAIQLTSPSGKVTAVNGNGCQGYNQESTFTETGDWHVQYAFLAFAGTVSAHAESYQRATATSR